MSDDDMVWEKKLVGRPKGTSYSQSHTGDPGDQSPLVRSDDDNSLSTHVRIRDIDDEDDSSDNDQSGLGGVVATVIVALGAAAATWGINQFVNKGVPAIKKKLHERRARKLAAEIAVEVAEAEPSVGDEVEESSKEISTQQWYRLFFDAVTHGAASQVHGAISVDAWEALVTARITDDPDTQALAQAMRELTPEQVNNHVKGVLEAHPELLSEDPEVVLARLFADTSMQQSPKYLEQRHDGAK